MSERAAIPYGVGQPGWIDEFEAFIMRGNVIDLAVGIIGVAFTAAAQRGAARGHPQPPCRADRSQALRLDFGAYSAAAGRRAAWRSISDWIAALAFPRKSSWCCTAKS